MELIDAMGIPLAEHSRWLPDRVALWPTPRKIVDKEAAGKWKRRTCQRVGATCWWCGEFERPNGLLETHHMARHDAPWAFALLCADCHRHTEAAVHSSSLFRLLTLKHKYDHANCSWLHLALGLGRRLPTEGDV